MTQTDQPQNLTAELRLRPVPKPVLRLSRKALTVMGVAGGAAVGGALMLALTPAKTGVTPPPAPPPAAKRPAGNERLNQLPKTYSDVPVLGPPLPGDLGHPMLEAGVVDIREGHSPAVDTSISTSMHREASPRSPAEEARSSARNSPVFTQIHTPQTPSIEPPTPLPVPPELSAFLAPQPPTVRTSQEKQGEFLRMTGDRQVASEERLMPPASPYLIQAGSVLPAALVTGIRSDLPGQVVAQVTQDVYDSLGRGFLLIPRGSRLLGEYDNAIAFGQSRVLLAWKRLILPNGKSLVLERLSATDVRGNSGLQDRTDYHWDSIVGAAALSTLLSMGAEAGSSDNDSEIVRALRDGAADSVSRTGQRIVERQLNIAPTLTIRLGHRVRVIISRDLVLEPYGD